jgi:hypothetical protein
MAEKLRLEDFGIEKLSDAITELSPVQTIRVTGKDNLEFEELTEDIDRSSKSKK